MASELASETVSRASASSDRPVTLVDSSVLLDILTEDPVWLEWSSESLIRATDEGRLVTNPIIYAEVSASFAKIEDLDAAVPADDLEREPLPYPAGFVAAKAFLTYASAAASNVRHSPTSTSARTPQCAATGC